MRLYECNRCGTSFMVLDDGGVILICCSESITQLQADVTDGAAEKYVAVVERDGDKITVKVGSAPHPMLSEHHIEWIAIEQGGKIKIAKLDPASEPVAESVVDGDVPIMAYEHCNLHGLWRPE